MSDDTNYISEIKQLRIKRNKLDDQRRALMSQADRLSDQIRETELQMARLTYTCCCVALNKELGIFDMGQQARAGRVGLGCGLVAEGLSARKNCPFCHGQGKLNNNEDEVEGT